MSKQIITAHTPQFGNPDFVWGAYFREGDGSRGCYGKTEAEALANLKAMIGDAEFETFRDMWRCGGCGETFEEKPAKQCCTPGAMYFGPPPAGTKIRPSFASEITTQQITDNREAFYSEIRRGMA